MKKIILLFCFIVISIFCLSACNKTEKKSLPQTETEVPEFEDYLESFINNDESAIEKLKKGEIAPCESISSLIQYYLQDKDEETCIRIVKLASDNKGKMVYGMDFSNPLIESCKMSYYELTKYLLTTPAKEYINYPFSQYAPALFWAIQNANIELVELLLKNGADPNSETHYGRTYMDEVDDFVVRKKLTIDIANKIKKLLIQYGYTDN
ncbi:MAG: ankyrin repeat domain-containing protein [Treponema sp.]|nr:ankyrin repeat domain-containing protein [Treponema sp.]